MADYVRLTILSKYMFVRVERPRGSKALRAGVCEMRLGVFACAKKMVTETLFIY